MKEGGKRRGRKEEKERRQGRGIGKERKKEGRDRVNTLNGEGSCEHQKKKIPLHPTEQSFVIWLNA